MLARGNNAIKGAPFYMRRALHEREGEKSALPFCAIRVIMPPDTAVYNLVIVSYSPQNRVLACLLF